MARQPGKARAAAAQAYFRRHAAEWDRIRKLHVADDAVEATRQCDLVAPGFGSDLICQQTFRRVEVFLRFPHVAAIEPNAPLIEVGPRQRQDVVRPVRVVCVQALESFFGFPIQA